MFVKMFLRDRLDCFADFVGMILLSSLPPFNLRLNSSNCFLRVCFPTFFAADLKDFLPVITSPVSGAANSNMSAPMRFAAGATYLRKKKNTSSPNNLCKSPKSPSPLPSNRSIVWNFYLS